MITCSDVHHFVVVPSKIRYTRHRTKTNNEEWNSPEKLARLGTQDTTVPFFIVCLCPVSCVPNLASFSGLFHSSLFVFVLCLVYLILLVSLDCSILHCLSLSCVLCTQRQTKKNGTVQRNYQD
jgi:hypothetical protein